MRVERYILISRRFIKSFFFSFFPHTCALDDRWDHEQHMCYEFGTAKREVKCLEEEWWWLVSWLMLKWMLLKQDHSQLLGFWSLAEVKEWSGSQLVWKVQENRVLKQALILFNSFKLLSALVIIKPSPDPTKTTDDVCDGNSKPPIESRRCEQQTIWAWFRV